MSPTPDELRSLGADLAAKLAGRKCVVVGVGNDLRGDDAAGVRLAERLQAALLTPAGGEGAPRDEQPVSCGQVPSPAHPFIFLAGDVPENYAVKVADLRPEVVLLLDAAAMGLAPGSCRLLRAEELPPVPGVTHRPSLEMFAAFVRLDCGAETYLLGIQPNLAHVGIGDPMSPEVETALEALEPILIEVLSPSPEPASPGEGEGAGGLAHRSFSEGG